jgi:MFS family permease
VRPRVVWAIGCGQLINWGVTYFAFSVLLVPLEQSLNAPRWLVAGAFSLGLLLSALVAPLVGRLADRGHGPIVMQIGGLVAAAALFMWAAVPALWMTYLAWAIVGLCMAAILYEPVFAMIGRAIGDADGRMRAIATVTVMGGLASSAFLPGTAALVNRWGWRGAVIVLGGVMAITTLIVGRIAFSDLAWSAQTIRSTIRSEEGERTDAPLPGINRFVAVFAVSSMVNSAVASNLVAALIDGGFAATMAATVAGSFGIMQLPGRLLMTNRRFSPKPIPLIVFSFALQIVGLIALMYPGTTALAGGVMIFAAGAGLTTLARPYWVLHAYGAGRAGYANGVIARGQQIARAAGPVSAAAMATTTGYAAVFASLAVMLIAASGLTLPRNRRNPGTNE